MLGDKGFKDATKQDMERVMAEYRECGMFLARERGRIVGVINVYRIPQIRKGEHCAEVEEVYVIPEFRGKGVAKQLMDAVVKWTKSNRVRSVRLESGRRLKRAHAFYEKCGFKSYARAYEMKI